MKAILKDSNFFSIASINRSLSPTVEHKEGDPINETWTISPEFAAQILAKSAGNRSIRKGAVAEYAKVIRDGRWQLTHQGLAVTVNGVLVDGHHRLLAIIKTGITIRMQVCVNAKPKTFQAIDRGRNRSAADLLTIRNVPNGKMIAAVARVALMGLSGSNVLNDEVDAFASVHEEVIREFGEVDKKFTAAAAGAFTRAKLAGWNGISSAAARLQNVSFNGANDPMAALQRRFNDPPFRKSKAQNRYAVTVAALRAVHECRELSRVTETSIDIKLAWP